MNKPHHESIWGSLFLVGGFLVIAVTVYCFLTFAAIGFPLPSLVAGIGFGLFLSVLGQLLRIHQVLHCIHWEVTEQRRLMNGPADDETKKNR
jgi:hypothetical protein